MSEGAIVRAKSTYMNKARDELDALYMNNLTEEQTDTHTDKQDEQEKEQEVQPRTSFCLEPLGFSGRSTSKTSLFDDQSPGFEAEPQGICPWGEMEGGRSGSNASTSDPIYDMVANLFDADTVLEEPCTDEPTHKRTDNLVACDDMPGE